ncbi:MAG: hypothetical protein Q4F57_03365 [Weeksellaceae bacterium]|nr:hypothetical protein [Weeksellaceae bacterium]
MKKLRSTLLIAGIVLGMGTMNAQNCDGLEITLNQHVQARTFSQGYPVLQQALQQCPDKKINYYNFGETILVSMIANTQNEAEKAKYARELSELIDKRLKNFPNEKKTFWQGEKINYELQYGLIDQKEALNRYDALFAVEDDDEEDSAQKVSANTTLNYFVTALELLNEQKVDFDKALEVYFATRKLAEDNIDLRSEEYGVLAVKLDSLQQIDPNKKLSDRETQIMAIAQQSKDLFVTVHEQMEGILSEYTTCENVAPTFANQFEEKKNDFDWLTNSLESLAMLECFDSDLYAALDQQRTAVWRKNNPQAATTTSVAPTSSRGTVTASSYARGVTQYNSNNFSAALSSFNEALNEVSGAQRGDVSYYIALTHQKMGNNTQAINAAKRAAGFKAGWGAPYQLIASIYGSNANSCGSTTFQKLTAYWIAADYANRACSVDSRSCGWARSAAASYEANGPTAEMVFQQGLSKGARVSVTCFGGESTRVR